MKQVRLLMASRKLYLSWAGINSGIEKYQVWFLLRVQVHTTVWLLHLAAESVQGLALALERVDNVHGGHGLSAGVLGVGDRVTDHVLQENLEDTAGLLVDEARDALDTTTACKTADGRLGDALDVVTQHLAVALGASLSESLSSFSTSRHVDKLF